MLCACMHAYVHVDSHLRNRKLEHEDSVSSVSPPRMLSYEAREAYVHVMRLIFVSCAYVCAPSSHMLYKVEACSVSSDSVQSASENVKMY